MGAEDETEAVERAGGSGEGRLLEVLRPWRRIGAGWGQQSTGGELPHSAANLDAGRLSRPDARCGAAVREGGV